jgi:putative flippase GtrA
MGGMGGIGGIGGMGGISSLLAWPVLRRFIKFGIVGASGIAVNLVMLYVFQEHLLAFIDDAHARLNFSVPAAIVCATINNFAWNRRWTWADRGAAAGGTIALQFVKYAAACWLGSTIQFVVTKLLASHWHYLLANVIAIGVASIFNFLLNDRWTFERRTRAQPRSVP